MNDAERIYAVQLLTRGMPDRVAEYDYAAQVLNDPFRYRPVGISESEYLAEIERLRAAKSST